MFVFIYREIVRNFLCKNLKNKKNIFHKKINSQNFPLIESLNYSQKIENCNQNENNYLINNFLTKTIEHENIQKKAFENYKDYVNKGYITDPKLTPDTPKDSDYTSEEINQSQDTEYNFHK